MLFSGGQISDGADLQDAELEDLLAVFIEDSLHELRCVPVSLKILPMSMPSIPDVDRLPDIAILGADPEDSVDARNRIAFELKPGPHGISSSHMKVPSRPEPGPATFEPIAIYPPGGMIASSSSSA